MSTPDPLVFPTDHDGWLAFVTERPAAAVALIADIDARLAAIAEAEAVDAAEVVDLWNDADIALHRATSEVYLLSESHPDEDVRAAAEAEVQRLEALGAERLQRRELFAAVAAAEEAAVTAGL